MKLSEVTLEDAKEIIKAGYATFFLTGRWQLSDESKGLNEPVMRLFSNSKVYSFYFFDDQIKIDIIPDDNEPINLDDVHYDVCYKCYIKAVRLGYYVPELTELLIENQ